MSIVIILNGTSSAGKTSIARALQAIDQRIWLHLGVDSLINMLPLPKKNDFMGSTKSINDLGPLVKIKRTETGESFFSCLPSLVKVFADQGFNVIVDEIIRHDQTISVYADVLAEHETYLVGVRCDTAIVLEREIIRRDRQIGMANGQFDIVHNGFRPYDIVIDTTQVTPYAAAQKIVTFLKNIAKISESPILKVS